MDSTKRCVAVSELRTHLLEYLSRVKQGEQWVVTEKGRPVALLEPFPKTSAELAHLVAKGAVRQGTGVVPTEFWDLPVPEDLEASLRTAVLEERRQ